MPAHAMAKTTSSSAARPWSRSETLGLANEQCNLCHGIGLRLGRALTPCNCVLRSIFRICYNRYREVAEKEKYLSKPTLELSATHRRRTMWGRRDEEYLADFYLVSKRNLSPREWDLFRFYFILGADWKLCAARLKIDRGNFFHAVYRIEQRLGKIFRELKPFALYPLDEYFSPARVIVQPAPPPKRGPAPVRPPRRKSETLDS